MTQRTEARFKAVSRVNYNIGNGSTLRYNIIVFNEGGTYNTSNYKYTVDNAGTYLIGYSHTKRFASFATQYPAYSYLELTRGGISTTISSSSCVTKSGGIIISNYLMYQFEEGDIIGVKALSGQPRMNQNSYSGTDVKNSFFGIKLNY